MGKEIEFKSGDEKNNMERVKRFFELSHSGEKQQNCEYFGRALGCLWAIYENRSWWNRWGLFKSGKTGLKPVAEKIKDFVKSGEGYFGRTFLELLKVLTKSVLRGEKDGVWSKSSRNGILGKEDVLDAIDNIQTTIETSVKPAVAGNNAAPLIGEEYPSKAEVEEGVNIWGCLQSELKKRKIKQFGNNLITQATQMLLGQVKKGIISEYTSLLKDKKKVNRWFKGGELAKLGEIRDRLKDAEREEKEKNGFSMSVYNNTIKKVTEEAANLLKNQKNKIDLNKMLREQGNPEIYINENFDIDWVRRKIGEINRDIEEYNILDAMSDARRFRGRLLGSIEGLYTAVQDWTGNNIVHNYSDCINAVRSMLRSSMKTINKITSNDKKKKREQMRQYLTCLKDMII